MIHFHWPVKLWSPHPLISKNSLTENHEFRFIWILCGTISTVFPNAVLSVNAVHQKMALKRCVGCSVLKVFVLRWAQCFFPCLNKMQFLYRQPKGGAMYFPKANVFRLPAVIRIQSSVSFKAIIMLLSVSNDINQFVESPGLKRNTA